MPPDNEEEITKITWDPTTSYSQYTIADNADNYWINVAADLLNEAKNIDGSDRFLDGFLDEYNKKGKIVEGYGELYWPFSNQGEIL